MMIGDTSYIVWNLQTPPRHVWCYWCTVIWFYKFLLVVILKKDFDKACDVVWKTTLIFMRLLW